jgi:hypothetical protein
MHDERLAQAIHNNAVWCDSVCRAHGSLGEFLEDIWVNRWPTPPFYPNAITLAPTRAAGRLASIAALIDGGLCGAWGVKDSFCDLDLAPMGFRVLFDGAWFWRRASAPRLHSRVSGVHWGTVRSEADLAEWETAWAGGPVAGQSEPPARIFLPPLLEDPTIAILAAHRDGRVVAGAIASRDGDVAGLSNLFVPPAEAAEFRAGCVAAAMDACPGLPLVGYVAGHGRAAMQTLGFEFLGPLRIWERQRESPPSPKTDRR